MAVCDMMTPQGKCTFPLSCASRSIRSNCGACELGEEDKLGSIEVGKLSDLVVVSGDYMTVPEDDISEIKTLLTMVGGRVVYEMGGAGL